MDITSGREARPEDNMALTETQVDETQVETSNAAVATRLIEQLSARYVEREEVARLLVLATIARQNVLLLGPPGVAKSALVTDFAGALGWDTFVRLLGRTSTPEEVFGPPSLAALRNNRYEREIQGYLPTAEVAFLDEVFKANSAILNSLLTALNERRYDHGTQRVDLPLRLCVAASNELPQDDGLEALYDRFLCRIEVAPIRSETKFAAMLAAPVTHIDPVPPGTFEALTSEAEQVDVSQIIPHLVQLRTQLAKDHEIRPSDRRWRLALGIVRASAALAGRTVATAKDLQPLAHVLWDVPTDALTVRDALMACRAKELMTLSQLVGEAREKVQICHKPQLTVHDTPALGTARSVIQAMIEDAVQLADQAPVEDHVEAMELVAELQECDRVVRATLSRLLNGVDV